MTEVYDIVEKLRYSVVATTISDRFIAAIVAPSGFAAVNGDSRLWIWDGREACRTSQGVVNCTSPPAAIQLSHRTALTSMPLPTGWQAVGLTGSLSGGGLDNEEEMTQWNLLAITTHGLYRWNLSLTESAHGRIVVNIISEEGVLYSSLNRSSGGSVISRLSLVATGIVLGSRGNDWAFIACNNRMEARDARWRLTAVYEHYQDDVISSARVLCVAFGEGSRDWDSLDGGDAVLCAAYDNGDVVLWSLGDASNSISLNISAPGDEICSLTICRQSDLLVGSTAVADHYNPFGWRLVVGTRRGILRTYEVLADSNNSSRNLQLRPVASINLARELRERFPELASESSQSQQAVKRELRCWPLALYWTRDEAVAATEISNSTHQIPIGPASRLVIVTSDAWLLADARGTRIIAGLPTSAVQLTHVLSAAISAPSIIRRTTAAYIVSIASLERSLYVSNLAPALLSITAAAATIESSNNAGIAARLASRSSSRPRASASTAGSKNIPPRAPGMTHRRTDVGTDDTNYGIGHDEEIELDFFTRHDEDDDPDNCRPSFLDFDLPALARAAESRQAQDKAAAQKAMKGGRSAWEAPLRSASGKLLDAPVTFHSRVKSSGYGQTVDPFTASLEAKRKARTARSSSNVGVTARSQSAPRRGRSNSTGRPSGGANQPLSSAPRLRMYPMDCAPPSTHEPEFEYPEASTVSSGNASPVFHIAYSGDATRVAVASSSSVVSILRMGRGGVRGITSLMGHNAAIKTVSWSHQKTPEPLLLTSSADCTVRMWKPSRVEGASLIFSHTRHHVTDAKSLTPIPTNSTSTMAAAAAAAAAASNTDEIQEARNRPFGGEIRAAEWFYCDKFALVAVKSSLHLYAYDVDHSAPSSGNSISSRVRRDESQNRWNGQNGRYQRVHEWNFSSTAQQVTALACHNDVQSHLILCATSAKTLHALDATNGNVLRTFEETTERSVSSLAVSTISPHIPLSRSSHNIFLSLSMDSTAVCWDLRQRRPIVTLTGHVNRRELIRGALSPCLKYVSTGSEDGYARIWDLRMGRELTRVGVDRKSGRDVASCVAFNPLFAQLAIGSYDGSVRFFADPSLGSY